MAQLLKLNGTTIKKPTSFSISRFNLTKSGRVASGKMVMDLVAKKRKFSLEYEVINGSDLQQILDIIDGDDLFFTLAYVENGIEKSATVYAGELPTTQFRTDGAWYWKDFKLSLIEQ